MRLQVRTFLLLACGRQSSRNRLGHCLCSLFVLRMSDIISRRQRTPWFWPDFVYYAIGDGREHDSTLKVLHSFTYNVSSSTAILERRLPDSTLSRPPFRS